MKIILTENQFNNILTDKEQEMETQRRLLSAFGDEFEYYTKDYHSNPANYKDNIYYRVAGGSGAGYGGLGNGLYLGRDPNALESFYNIDGGGKLQTYIGKPKWLDLRNYKKMDKFENTIKEKNIKIINSNDIGNYVKNLGYDGIIYLDPEATLEEYVLYNTNKLKRLS